ncbi:tryptophan 2,3-dioxygenase [Kutzneria viridogrisea]|uniref:Tryptophan 2,3-dioxygenase n=2 Tax=Kutzneria TaxID=43356 RepID=W5WFB5_9PSEU|nr:tryptophan 2,3-dioxygenase family protein [Kutzneria albida]AHH99271.1 hypothetical protein KALB_5910 [Kutzneria albida DSM 43870]MBA8923175.1 tryptophan 2,3-dioxygenase [Kutzneria viridogrisea]
MRESEGANVGGRAYRPLSERERRERAERTGGEPEFDFGASAESTPYIDYHHVDVLLSLQHPRTQEPAELSFYICGQVQELLFKLLFTEVNLARDLLFARRLDPALAVLRRTERTLRVLVTTWEPLSTITVSEFHNFRDELGEASGFQSYMYRQLEFALGNKSPRMAEAHRGVDWVYKQVDAALRAPSLYDAALSYLHSQGVELPAGCFTRDPAEPAPHDPAVQAAWARVYREPERHHGPYLLAEALSDLNYQYARWRSTHLLTVERVIGGRPGSGGTDGVGWLRRIAEHRFFPELSAARCTG